MTGEIQSQRPSASDETATVDVSVIIPTYNRCELTQRAIDSVLAQQHAGVLEIIVVDDGSTDGTPTLLHSRYDTNPRVRIIQSNHGGASAARNAGFKASCGELICFLDSDDVWTQGAIEVAMQVFALHSDLAFVSMDGSVLPLHGSVPLQRVMRMTSPGWSHAGFATAPLTRDQIRLHGASQDTAILRGDFFPAIAYGDLFSLNGLYMRRDAVARAGPFNERFRWFNDWDFSARLCLQGHGVYLDHEGFRRDVGRADEISRGRKPADMPRRHLYILHTLPRRFPEQTAHYQVCLQMAMVDAQYQMGAVFAGSRHWRYAWRYLRRSMRMRYKVGKCMVYLVRSWLPLHAG
jgi:glycosyltransferase involved in cell wall biosynthesis